MRVLFRSRTVSVAIGRSPAEVYDFVADPANLPLWATAFCRSVRQEAGQWVVDTPDGVVGIRFIERNTAGLLDHWVSPPGRPEMHMPMRVVPNAMGSEVLLTIFQQPDQSDEKHVEDARWMERDLRMLKAVLEEEA